MDNLCKNRSKLINNYDLIKVKLNLKTFLAFLNISEISI